MCDLRDGPFDIQGGGWDFSSRQVIFSLFFAQQVIFSKVNCNKFFIFFKNNTLNSENCTQKQHIERKSSKNLKSLFDH